MYSVLMSVYWKEKPEYLQAAIESMLRQTIPPAEFILVCDGPLTDGLDRVVTEYGDRLSVIRLKKNGGLGNALAEGLRYCSREWVFRMDSDDIAAQNRCELQLEYVKKHPGTAVLSGTIAEFSGEALVEEEAKKLVYSYKSVPETDSEIRRYIKKRNPMNHPCVMFRKERVLEAGNYQACPFFEDYDLWMRMSQNNCRMANLSETLLYMRVDDMHKRRGGKTYAKAIAAFYKKMYDCGLLTRAESLYMMTMRVTVSLLPNAARKWLYDKKLRRQRR